MIRALISSAVDEKILLLRGPGNRQEAGKASIPSFNVLDADEGQALHLHFTASIDRWLELGAVPPRRLLQGGLRDGLQGDDSDSDPLDVQIAKSILQRQILSRG